MLCGNVQASMCCKSTIQLPYRHLSQNHYIHGKCNWVPLSTPLTLLYHPNLNPTSLFHHPLSCQGQLLHQTNLKSSWKQYITLLYQACLPSRSHILLCSFWDRKSCWPMRYLIQVDWNNNHRKICKIHMTVNKFPMQIIIHAYISNKAINSFFFFTWNFFLISKKKNLIKLNFMAHEIKTSDLSPTTGF